MRAGGFRGLSSVSISSPSFKPRRSLGSVLQDPPEMLFVVAGLHSGVSSYHFTDLREGDSCMLGEDLARFHHATSSFSTKAFTSNCSSPLPKKEQFFFLQIRVNVALEPHHVLINGSFSQ